MKKLITIILALVMALFTAPNRSADQPHLTAVKTPQMAIVTQVKQQAAKHRAEHEHARKRNVRAVRATSRARPEKDP